MTFVRKIDNAVIEVRRTEPGDFVLVTVLRGVNPKFLDLTRGQAIAIRDGLDEVIKLGEVIWPSYSGQSPKK